MLRALALAAALPVALHVYLERAGPRARPGRAVLAFGAGGAFAHLGFALLHPEAVASRPGLLLDLQSGFCALFVVAGPLCLAPRKEGRAFFLRAALGALPAALAVARLGCLAAGCCGGRPLAAALARDHPALPAARALGLAAASGGLRHPTALYDLVGCLLLHRAAGRIPPDRVPGGVLAGLGALRLLLDPLRADAPPGPPSVEVRWLAWSLLAAGAACWVRPPGLPGSPRGFRQGPLPDPGRRAEDVHPGRRAPACGDPGEGVAAGAGRRPVGRPGRGSMLRP